MLKREHIQSLNKTRQILRRYEQETWGGEFPEGKFGEACRAAEIALLNVLIVARTWMDGNLKDSDLYIEDEEANLS